MVPAVPVAAPVVSVEPAVAPAFASVVGAAAPVALAPVAASAAPVWPLAASAAATVVAVAGVWPADARLVVWSAAVAFGTRISATAKPANAPATTRREDQALRIHTVPNSGNYLTSNS